MGNFRAILRKPLINPSTLTPPSRNPIRLSPLPYNKSLKSPPLFDQVGYSMKTVSTGQIWYKWRRMLQLFQQMIGNVDWTFHSPAEKLLWVVLNLLSAMRSKIWSTRCMISLVGMPKVLCSGRCRVYIKSFHCRTSRAFSMNVQNSLWEWT